MLHEIKIASICAPDQGLGDPRLVQDDGLIELLAVHLLRDQFAKCQTADILLLISLSLRCDQIQNFSFVIHLAKHEMLNGALDYLHQSTEVLVSPRLGRTVGREPPQC